MCGLIPIVVVIIAPIPITCVVAPIFACRFVAPIMIFVCCFVTPIPVFVVGACVRGETLRILGESASPISVFWVSSGVLGFGFWGRGFSGFRFTE